MLCPKCHTQNPENSKFCAQCGNFLRFHLEGLPAGLAFLLAFLYFVILEWLFSTTLFKLLFHLRVYKENGSKCDFLSALIRNLLLIIDVQFFGAIGATLIAKSAKKQRLGDMVAKTIIVQL